MEQDCTICYDQTLDVNVKTTMLRFGVFTFVLTC